MLSLKIKQRLGYNKRAFTLIELLVVIAIIGILSTLVIVALGNSRTSARDSKRLNDLKAMANALELYYANNNSYPASITPGQLLELGGVVYMGKIPSNPTPWTDGGCPDSDYTYTQVDSGQSYNISACLGTQAANSPSVGFTTVTYSPSGLFQCGQQINDIDGNQYKTAQIGTQCWMKENLKTKTKPNGVLLTSAERFCPPASTGTTPGNEADCDLYGALYTHTAVMNSSTAEGAQGICPDSWHIPTDSEFKTLEMFLGMSQEQADLGSSWRGTDEGRKLRSQRTLTGNPPPHIIVSEHPYWLYNNGNFGTDTSGFSALGGGSRGPGQDGSFGNRSVYSYLWSSSGGWMRALIYYTPTIMRNSYPATYGFSARCLKN